MEIWQVVFGHIQHILLHPFLVTHYIIDLWLSSRGLDYWQFEGCGHDELLLDALHCQKKYKTMYAFWMH